MYQCTLDVWPAWPGIVKTDQLVVRVFHLTAWTVVYVGVRSDSFLQTHGCIPCVSHLVSLSLYSIYSSFAYMYVLPLLCYFCCIGENWATPTTWNQLRAPVIGIGNRAFLFTLYYSSQCCFFGMKQIPLAYWCWLACYPHWKGRYTTFVHLAVINYQSQLDMQWIIHDFSLWGTRVFQICFNYCVIASFYCMY